MGDNYWSQSTCRPDVWWYGIPGSGSYYWTQRFGQYWVGGDVYREYKWRNWECGPLIGPVKDYGWITEFGGGGWGQWFEGGAIVYTMGAWRVYYGNYGQTAGRLSGDFPTDDSEAEKPPTHEEMLSPPPPPLVTEEMRQSEPEEIEPEGDPQMNRTLSRLGRTILQVIAAGGLTAVIDAIRELSPRYEQLIAALNLFAIVTVQNWLESHGTVPTLLESPHSAPPPAR